MLAGALVVLVVAAATYLGLGWVALGEMYRIYGSSGHPPAPSAPKEVLVGMFLVALPAVSLLIALGCLWLGRKLLLKVRGSGAT